MGTKKILQDLGRSGVDVEAVRIGWKRRPMAPIKRHRNDIRILDRFDNDSIEANSIESK